MSLALANEALVVHDQCESIEQWAAECQSVPELRDASNRLAAIDEYLQRTSTEGRSRVAAAMRRLEVRIGELLGPAKVGAHSSATEGADLSRHQRQDFREMAAHPDVVEKVIDESTDDEPASRRKVQDAIQRERPSASLAPAPKPRRSSLTDSAMKAGWEFRRAVERMERIVTDDRFPANREQVAAHLNDHLFYALEVCQDLVEHMKGISK